MGMMGTRATADKVIGLATADPHTEASRVRQAPAAQLERTRS